MRRSTIRIALALAVVGLLLPSTGRADHCGGNIVVFTGNLFPEPLSDGLRTVRDTAEGVVSPWPAPARIPTQPVWVNSGALSCDVLGHDYDGRIINPGATHFSLRYLTDLGPEVPTLTGTISGMGFDQTEVTLDRVQVSIAGTASWVYDSIRMPFANPAAAEQYIFVVLNSDPEIPETVCFHTVVGSCSDF